MGQTSFIRVIATTLLFGVALGMEEWKQQLLSQENHYREIHGSEPLTYNPELEQRAQEWADNVGQNMCTWAPHHAPRDNPGMSYNGIPLGENINKGKMIGNGDLQKMAEEGAASSAGAFYKEIEGYPFGDYDPFVNHLMGHDHFTQMVWKSTKEVGYGLVTCGGDMWFMIARYFPTGNVASPQFNAYKDNVLPPQQ